MPDNLINWMADCVPINASTTEWTEVTTAATIGTTAATMGTTATTTTLDEDIVNIDRNALWNTVRPYDLTGVRQYDLTESLNKVEALRDRVEKLERNMSLLMRMFDKLTAKQMKELLE